jgi:hypothetical protein
MAQRRLDALRYSIASPTFTRTIWPFSPARFCPRLLGGGMDDSTSFGTWLTHQRKAHDLTQDELARRLAAASPHRLRHGLAYRLLESGATPAYGAPRCLAIVASARHCCTANQPRQAYDRRWCVPNIAGCCGSGSTAVVRGAGCGPAHSQTNTCGVGGREGHAR